MANTIIQLKNSGTLGSVPSSLSPGEIAINHADGKLYYGNSTSAAILFDTITEPSGLDGEIQFNSSGSFGASANLSFNVSTKTLITDSISARGDVVASGYLKSLNSSGDEGGEILLSKPQANTSLDGVGVTIDVYQNKIRFFEQGGSARGVFIDLTTTSSGAGTNLLSGVGGGVVSVAGANGAISNTQILDGIKNVDGSGSGLDADLLDGQHGTYYTANAGAGDIAVTNAYQANVGAARLELLANTGAGLISAKAVSEANVGAGLISAKAVSEANVGAGLLTKLNTTGGTISGDLSVTGNLTIIGNTTTINVSTLKVTDSIIQLAVDNQSDLLDIGFIGHYNNTPNNHTGLVRKYTDGVYYLFDSYTPGGEPTNTIDIANTRVATLSANIVSNVITLGGLNLLNYANIIFNTANAAFEKANVNPISPYFPTFPLGLVTEVVNTPLGEHIDGIIYDMRFVPDANLRIVDAGTI